MENVSRRKFLALSAASTGALLLGVTGCAPPTSTASQSAPAAAAPKPGVAQEALTHSAPVDEKALITNMTQATLQWVDSLDPAQRDQATYAFDDEERLRWHWTTPRNFPRNGLPLREMTEDQKTHALALLQTSISGAGLEKALNIMSLQRDLGNDPELYYVTVFGMPGAGEPWGWRWEGHHLSRQFTVVGDQVAVTPLFHGSWPTTTDSGLRAMPREEDAALELANSLIESTHGAVIFQDRTLTSHVTQNAPRVSPLDPVGVSYADMTGAQQQLLTEVVRTYLGAMPELIATANFARIDSAGLDQLRFGWAGSLEHRRPQYYRLQGPTFLLEFDNSRNGGTHIHSVWRDFERDFGYHLL